MISAQTANPPVLPKEMQDALSRFEKQATEITGEFKSELNKIAAPPVLYHYTTDVGLRGILESGRLWLTDIFALNDPSELRHGFLLAANALDNKLQGGSPECEAFARIFRNSVIKGIDQIAHYFSCSFSEQENDLSQWRAYADDGRGYVISFEGSSLEQSFCKRVEMDVSDAGAFPVNYGDQTLGEIHLKLVEKLLPLISLPRGLNPTRELLNDYYRELSTNLASHVLDISLYFKHMAYGNEKEYRFLELYRFDRCPEVKFRPRGYDLIKYLEFDWRSIGEDVLKKIVVGPAADYEKARAFAQRCLDDFGFKHVDIVRSDIPYRSSR